MSNFTAKELKLQARKRARAEQRAAEYRIPAPETEPVRLSDTDPLAARRAACPKASASSHHTFTASGYRDFVAAGVSLQEHIKEQTS